MLVTDSFDCLRRGGPSNHDCWHQPINVEGRQIHNDSYYRIAGKSLAGESLAN